MILEATDVTFYSPRDEAAFFEWLDKIRCVDSYRGRSRTLYITLDRAASDEDGLRELVALYRRYGIDRKKLRLLDGDRLGRWFSDPARRWHDEVFG